MRIWLHKLRHWEYWPVYIIYLPAFFLWIGYMIRFRKIKFFELANPGIKNGGFYGDSKYEIYKLLPPGTYPKTILIRPNVKLNPDELIKEYNLHLPLIAKPDVGLRGIGVQKITNVEEWDSYHKASKQNYLIQEFIEFPNEIGLFYYRLPNSENSKISGITIKKFLSVTGNGNDTIEKLLKENPRFAIQIPTLIKSINLNEILKTGESRLLVPYGNHNRGTEFLDGKKYITEKMQETFNEILKKAEGFYFGRLDIRYNTFKELEQGLNFSIIELNGVKSEPTHIYDPKYSFWKGQLEIFRHQKIMKKIIKEKYSR